MSQAREPIGYVLSGSKTSYALFEPVEGFEERIREGMMVVIRDGARKIIGIITQIELYHEFYEKGGVWSEAIRRHQLPPGEVARKYMIAKVQLQGVIGERGLESVSRPPPPGARVYEADLNVLDSIYGFNSNRRVPSNKLVIGSLYGYSSVPAVIDLDKITMHFAVIGVTGSGKSNTIGVLIEELGARRRVSVGSWSGRTIPLVVFDANGDYLDYFEKPELIPSYKVIRIVFPQAFPSTALLSENLRELKINLNIFRSSVQDLAEAIYTLTRGGVIEGLELQLDLLTRTLNTAIASEEAEAVCPGTSGVDLNCLLASREGRKILEEIIEREREERKAFPQTAYAVKRSLYAFTDIIERYKLVDPRLEHAAIDQEFVEKVVDPQEPWLVIFDFSVDGAPGVDLRVKQFIVYYVLRLFFDKFVEYKTRGENKVAVIVIEEAQNYAPNQKEYPIGYSIARKMLALTATQGRKFGLSLALVTQRPGFVDPVIMSMMNSFIIHRVSTGDVRFVQLATGGLPKHISSKLSRLETGLAILVGQMNVFPHPVLATIRRRREHRAGSI